MPHLATVLARGNVVCGIDAARPDMAGFETDFCRAIAAALFDAPDAIDVRPLDLSEAPGALVFGEVDVYVGPNDQAWPDTHVNLTLFYDAAGAIARNDVGIRQLIDMKFATICLIQDSIEERLFNEAAQAARVKYQSLLFNAGDYDEMYKAYDQGRCDVVVDNRVRLAQRQPELTVPRDHAPLDLVLPIGTRGPLASSDDANWAAIVDTIGNSLVHAEELRVDSAGLDAALTSDNTNIRQLLGIDGNIGSSLSMSNDFVVRVLRHIGNYGEVYTRHFPALPRGPNALAEDRSSTNPLH